MSRVDIYDFAFIKRAPETDEKQPLDDVIKVLFIKNDGSLDTGYAVDFENNEVYIDPMIGSRGVRTGVETPKKLENASQLFSILEEHHVQDWKSSYSQKNQDDFEDGTGWQFWLQFSDGSVEKHSGSGVDVEKTRPENFSAFSQDFSEAIEKNVVDE